MTVLVQCGIVEDVRSIRSVRQERLNLEAHGTVPGAPALQEPVALGRGGSARVHRVEPASREKFRSGRQAIVETRQDRWIARTNADARAKALEADLCSQVHHTVHFSSRLLPLDIEENDAPFTCNICAQTLDS